MGHLQQGGLYVLSVRAHFETIMVHLILVANTRAHARHQAGQRIVPLRPGLKRKDRECKSLDLFWEIDVAKEGGA